MSNTKNISFRFHGTPIKGYPKTGDIKNASHEDIYELIMNKALVDENLPSGDTIRLDLTNYNKEHVVKQEQPEPVVFQEPVVVEEEQEEEESDEELNITSEPRQSYKKNPKRR